MYIDIRDQRLRSACGSEITSTVRRISIGHDRGCWRTAPDEIVIERRLTGGRGGALVIEANARWGNRRSGKVIKIGPGDASQREYEAYQMHLANASALFAPIEAATPGVLDSRRAKPGVPEGIVYDHASRFVGTPCVSPRTLEELVEASIERDGGGMDDVVTTVDALFAGVRNDLYDRCEVLPREESLEVAMNNRLGAAVVVEVDGYHRRSRRFTLGRPAAADLATVHHYPDDLFDASVNVDAAIHPGDLVHVVRLRPVPGRQRLFGRPAEDPRVEVELCGAGGRPISDIAAAIGSDREFDVYGRVRSTRARAQRDRLRAATPDLRYADDVTDGRTTVPDPFARLRHVLVERRPGRVVSTVHGDLNPRNVLAVERRPCLIDYAATASGQPLYLDFASLEGFLLVGPLACLGWERLVELQRRLGAASRRGDDVADHFADHLRSDPRLAAAFRLLWAIRRAARDVWPPSCASPWWNDHLVQLYLFAHIALRRPDRSAEGLRAAVALAGVATELLTDDRQGR